MNDERWQQVDAVFDAALELEGRAREDLLGRIGAEDPELRSAVERLLALESEAGAFLSGSAALDAFATQVARGDARGARIGPYRVEKLLGHGGMGEVYLAERADDQFEQRVAIKVLSGPGTPVLLRRFRTESPQAPATLRRHPSQGRADLRRPRRIVEVAW